MMKKIILFLLFTSFAVLNSCSQDRVNLAFDSEYSQYKKIFIKDLIDHFPRVLHPAKYHGLSCKTDPKKNNFGFLLYEYGVDDELIDSTVQNLEKQHIALYSSSDSCLLIVNRFETLVTLNNHTIPQILDSTLIERDCYKSKYPVPNFVEYDKNDIPGQCKLGIGFDLYILEAKHNFNFQRHDLNPNKQMPAFWSNGMSRGIAVNREQNVIIYWGIMW